MDIYEIKTDELLKFYDSSLYKFCETCENFGKRWSCPPVNKSTRDFLPQDKSYVAIEYAHSADERIRLNQVVENRLVREYETVFSSGSCDRCDVCLREKSERCDDFLYSSVVLCLDMVKLFNFLTGENLELDDYNMIFIMQGKR